MFRTVKETARKVAPVAKRAASANASQSANTNSNSGYVVAAAGVAAVGALALMNENNKAHCAVEGVDMAILKELSEIKKVLGNLDPTTKILGQVSPSRSAPAAKNTHARTHTRTPRRSRPASPPTPT